MPWGDGTGPVGFGPMTGRGSEYCAGLPTPGFMPGARFGRGRGWRNIFHATGLTGMQRAAMGFFGAKPPEPTREQEEQILKGQAEFLEEQLALLKKRLEELSAPDIAEGGK